MARASRRPSPRPHASPRRTADGSPDRSLAPRRGSLSFGPARAQRPRRSRSRAPRPTPPARPRSPTPRAGRRSARSKLHRRRPPPAQSPEQQPPVSRGNLRTLGGAAGGGSPVRSLGPLLGVPDHTLGPADLPRPAPALDPPQPRTCPRIPDLPPNPRPAFRAHASPPTPRRPLPQAWIHRRYALRAGPGARGKKGELPEAGTEPGERKRLLSASPEGEWREDNKLKRGIFQDWSPSLKLDKYKIAKQLTEKAIKEKKIFCIYGHYPVIRAALRRKGWVEKKLHLLPRLTASGEAEGGAGRYGRRADGKENQDVAVGETDDIHDMMSRLVRNETPYFLWTIKKDAVDYHSLSGDQALNHYGKTASFTTKIGLCLNMRSLPWYVQDNPETFFPRCYGLCSDSEKREFLDDFRRTAASSILKWVVSQQHCFRGKAQSRRAAAAAAAAAGDGDPSSQKGATADDPGPTGLSGQLVDTACRVCQAYLGQLEHEDIDVSEDAAQGLTEEEWQELTQQYYSLIHGDAVISDPRSHLSRCQALLNRISAVSPQTEIDGLRNIWIVKPAAKSRGRDIVCMDRVEDVLELVAADHLSAKDNRWVVQKYIETPLLIYDTKFDIRQWFLVTDWNPLTIWFYKESYLRFSTRRFSLDNLDSAVHLCNNSVQRHLPNDKGRSPLLPHHNMWTSTTFREYLQKKGRGSVWGSVIYPSMKRAVTHTMKVAQDHVEPRKGSFELYGADFVLGRDFRPWLIEINSSPTMHASTPVTARLCAQVQEDTIKVVVDRKGDRNCDIGNFELLWRQPAVDLPQVHGSDLCVEGVGVRKAKKPMPPIPNPHFLSPILDIQPVKVRCPSALSERAPGPPRTALPQPCSLRDRKVPAGPPPGPLPCSRPVRREDTAPGAARRAAHPALGDSPGRFPQRLPAAGPRRARCPPQTLRPFPQGSGAFAWRLPASPSPPAGFGAQRGERLSPGLRPLVPGRLRAVLAAPGSGTPIRVPKPPLPSKVLDGLARSSARRRVDGGPRCRRIPSCRRETLCRPVLSPWP
ncbi:protein monoglycylase TTLL8 [Phyllostomus discolor]|uniref:Protein monoglycylase TTLL8 n=1 Tax=Phyllostomus discolor TaxID=89673 RepID=A0A7E6D404_9CHIR|nr:protein monoglycylase TTLL8 [Phyllostomus discolor]